MKKTLATVAAVLLTATLANAAPFVATSVGDATKVTFSYTPEGASGPLTAFANLSVASISSTSLDLKVQLANTTGAGYINAGASSFGFSVDPNATGAAGSTTGSNDTASDTDVFGGFGLASIPSLSSIEICAWAGNGCAGGGQQGLLAKGQTDFFIITLNWQTPNAIVRYTLDNFGIKFQTDLGSFEFWGTGGPGSGSSGVTPEPASLAMLGLGLIVAAVRIRQRR